MVYLFLMGGVRDKYVMAFVDRAYRYGHGVRGPKAGGKGCGCLSYAATISNIYSMYATHIAKVDDAGPGDATGRQVRVFCEIGILQVIWRDGFKSALWNSE